MSKNILALLGCEINNFSQLETLSFSLGIPWLPLTSGILTGPWMMQLWPAATALSMSATVMSSVLAAAKVVVLSLVSVSMIVDFDS